MVLQAAAVENDLGDVFGLAALGDQAADFFGGILVRAGLLVGLEVPLGGVGGSDGFALVVIDDLGVNVLRREMCRRASCGCARGAPRSSVCGSN
jgi:hypothetical protein